MKSQRGDFKHRKRVEDHKRWAENTRKLARTPEYKRRQREYQREYQQRPEVKERQREYNQRLEVTGCDVSICTNTIVNTDNAQK